MRTKTFFISARKVIKSCWRGGIKNVHTSAGGERERESDGTSYHQCCWKPGTALIVFSYVRIPEYIAASVPTEWGIGTSRNGWMLGKTEKACNSLFWWPRLILHPWILRSNGIDRVSSAISKFYSSFATPSCRGIPSSQARLQNVWNWRLQNVGQTLRKYNFAVVFE